jgi:hypothetical protein
MDADVSIEPLFRAENPVNPSKLYTKVEQKGHHILSGGYNWSSADVGRALERTSLGGTVKTDERVIARLQKVIDTLNEREPSVRKELAEISAHTI